MKRKRTPKTQTIRPSARKVADSPEVLNWIRQLTRKGYSTKKIVDLSKSDGDYPLPGQPLSDGTVSGARSVIVNLELLGARFPLEPNGLRRSSNYSRRLHEIGQKRADARKAGESMVFWNAAYEVTQLAGLLQSLELEDVELDEQNLDTMTDLLEMLLYLAEWMERSLHSVTARMGEHAVLSTIEKLRRMTVANGCSEEEADNARRAAIRLERQLRAELTA